MKKHDKLGNITVHCNSKMENKDSGNPDFKFSSQVLHNLLEKKKKKDCETETKHLLSFDLTSSAWQERTLGSW